MRGAPPSTGRVTLRLLAAAGALAFLGNVPLMGIPGALWMEVAAPVAALFTDQRMPPDAGWPMAITVTLIWPWALPLAYLLAARLPGAGARWGVTLGLTALWAVGVAAAFQVSAGRLG